MNRNECSSPIKQCQQKVAAICFRLAFTCGRKIITIIIANNKQTVTNTHIRAVHSTCIANADLNSYAESKTNFLMAFTEFALLCFAPVYDRRNRAGLLHVSQITINYLKNVANSAACRRKRLGATHIFSAIGGHTVKIDRNCKIIIIKSSERKTNRENSRSYCAGIREWSGEASSLCFHFVFCVCSFFCIAVHSQTRWEITYRKPCQRRAAKTLLSTTRTHTHKCHAITIFHHT